MRAIVGIGNPGNSYAKNRHNVGFQFVDYFAQKKSISFKSSKFEYCFSEGELNNEPFVLIKPVTYVNNSGLAVLQCAAHYKIEVHNLLVVVDDINLTTSSLRIRKSGGDGGHNGLNSIIYHLNSISFPRMRIGIGNTFPTGKLPDYVLSDFETKDIEELKKTFDMCVKLVDLFILNGYQQMLNSFSQIKNIEKQNGNAN